MADGKKKETSCITATVSLILILGLLATTIAILCISRHEHPTKPIRLWIEVSLGLTLGGVILSCCCGANYISAIIELAYFAWWIVGMVWMISGGKKLLESAPILFWYTAVDIGIEVAVLVCLCCLFSCGFLCWTLAASVNCIQECARKTKTEDEECKTKTEDEECGQKPGAHVVLILNVPQS